MNQQVLSIPLQIYENGYWRDTENTIAVFDGLSNIPQVFQDIISQIDISKHLVVSKQSIKAPTNTGLIPLYRLTNTICNQSLFRANYIDAALQYNNPDIYFIHDNGMCLVEHDEGYVLICSVSVSGDLFWMIEGKIEDVQEGNWIPNKE